MATPHPFVKVEWVDASDPVGDESWFDDKDLEKFSNTLTRVVTAGWVWGRNKQYLTLVSDVIIEGVTKPVYGRPTKIPKGMIVSETIVEGMGEMPTVVLPASSASASGPA